MLSSGLPIILLCFVVLMRVMYNFLYALFLMLLCRSCWGCYCDVSKSEISECRDVLSSWCSDTSQVAESDVEGIDSTPLMFFAQKGDVEKVKVHMQSDAGKSEKHGITALMFASAGGNADCVRELLAEEAGMQDNDGITALMWAIIYKRSECVTLLSNLEACRQNKYGYTAMMFAVFYDQRECVERLLKAEAGMYSKNGRTALMIAYEKRNMECFDVLRKNVHECRVTKRILANNFLGNEHAVFCELRYILNRKRSLRRRRSR